MGEPEVQCRLAVYQTSKCEVLPCARIGWRRNIDLVDEFEQASRWEFTELPPKVTGRVELEGDEELFADGRSDVSPNWCRC